MLIVQVEAQQSAATQSAASEAEVRRSIQAEFDKKMNDAKLTIMKRALEVGKKKVSDACFGCMLFLKIYVYQFCDMPL